jgi:hypothetical protein
MIRESSRRPRGKLFPIRAAATRTSTTNPPAGPPRNHLIPEQLQSRMNLRTHLPAQQPGPPGSLTASPGRLTVSPGRLTVSPGSLTASPAGHASATRPTERSRPRPATTNDTPTSQ